MHESRSAKRCVQEEREWLETFRGLPSPLCNSVLARIKTSLKLMYGMGQEVRSQSYSETW